MKGTVGPDVVFQTVSKTGKKTSFWEAEAPATAAPEAPPAPAEAEAKPAEPVAAA